MSTNTKQRPTFAELQLDVLGEVLSLTRHDILSELNEVRARLDMPRLNGFRAWHRRRAMASRPGLRD